MSFVELDIFGVYVAPIAVMIVVAYGILYVIRRLLARLGWLERVWHPGLFDFALYLIILSLLVLSVAKLNHHA